LAAKSRLVSGRANQFALETTKTVNPFRRKALEQKEKQMKNQPTNHHGISAAQHFNPTPPVLGLGPADESSIMKTATKTAKTERAGSSGISTFCGTARALALLLLMTCAAPIAA